MSLFSAFKAAVNRNNTPAPATGNNERASVPGTPDVEATPELIGHPTSGTNLDPRKILIVDDNAADLAQLERDMEPMRAVWEMTFVQDPRQAVLELAKKHFDAVIADLEMPEVDGLSVLREV